MTNPFHQHDSEDDVYVGTFSMGDKAHDVWAERPDGEDEDTLIVRYGDEPHENRALPLWSVKNICRSGNDHFEIWGRAMSLYEAFQNGRKSL
jgi:hypothetical protein